jgi:hypothetical protein
MFGPDICGYATKKIHVILSRPDPKDKKGALKNHLIKKDLRAEDDQLTHVYTLRLMPNNTYAVYVDKKEVGSGKLEEDWDMLPPAKIKVRREGMGVGGERLGVKAAETGPKPPSPVAEGAFTRPPISPSALPTLTKKNTRNTHHHHHHHRTQHPPTNTNYQQDPKATKPEDWDERAEIDDPEDKKPDGWDDIPPTIADPKAKKPKDWSDEDDGEWEAPMVPNPEYKGEWKAKRYVRHQKGSSNSFCFPVCDTQKNTRRADAPPKKITPNQPHPKHPTTKTNSIPNPKYKGLWEAPEIDNPEYKPDDTLYVQKDLKYVAFELWQVKSGSIFDNIMVTDDFEAAMAFADETWGASKDAEKDAFDAAKKKEDEEKKAAGGGAGADDVLGGMGGGPGAGGGGEDEDEYDTEGDGSSGGSKDEKKDEVEKDEL